VVALPKGVVPEPAPALTAKPRRPADYFERTSPILAAAALGRVCKLVSWKDGT